MMSNTLERSPPPPPPKGNSSKRKWMSSPAKNNPRERTTLPPPADRIAPMTPTKKKSNNVDDSPFIAIFTPKRTKEEEEGERHLQMPVRPMPHRIQHRRRSTPISTTVVQQPRHISTADATPYVASKRSVVQDFYHPDSLTMTCAQLPTLDTPERPTRRRPTSPSSALSSRQTPPIQLSMRKNQTNPHYHYSLLFGDEDEELLPTRVTTIERLLPSRVTPDHGGVSSQEDEENEELWNHYDTTTNDATMTIDPAILF